MISNPCSAVRHLSLRSCTEPSTKASTKEISSEETVQLALLRFMAFGSEMKAESKRTTSNLAALFFVSPSALWATAVIVWDPAERLL